MIGLHGGIRETARLSVFYSRGFRGRKPPRRGGSVQDRRQYVVSSFCRNVDLAKIRLDKNLI